jgi:hypothetical protein
MVISAGSGISEILIQRNIFNTLWGICSLCDSYATVVTSNNILLFRYSVYILNFVVNQISSTLPLPFCFLYNTEFRMVNYSACHLLSRWFLARLILRPWRWRWCSSETSADFKRTTRRYIPQDGTLHNHRCENLISYIKNTFCCF